MIKREKQTKTEKSYLRANEKEKKKNYKRIIFTQQMKQNINKTITQTHIHTQEGLLNVYIFVLKKQIQANKQERESDK